jgi:hypothetical protein
MDSSLPATQQLTEVAKKLATIKDNSFECAKFLAQINLVANEEIKKTWRPLLEASFHSLSESSVVLQKAQAALTERPKNKWENCNPVKGLLPTLTRVAEELLALRIKLEYAQLEIGSRDLVVRLRSKALLNLPLEDRQALISQAHSAALMVGEGNNSDG